MIKSVNDLKSMIFTEAERAVVYARVSGDDRKKDDRNLNGQIEMGRGYATEKGYAIIDELPEDDKGASGYEIDLPKLNRIREMARNCEFDVLVVRELDRLSRNLAKQLIVEEELKRHGVRVEYVLADYDDSPEGRLQKHIRATVAEFEREKIKERMNRGKLLKVKAGKVMVAGRPPYGYRLNNDRTMLVIHEPEARIVRLIFQWYIQGDEEKPPLGMKAIATKLTELGVPTAADSDGQRKTNVKKRGRGEWYRATIYNILKNETYTGIWHYGKKNAKKKGDLPSVKVPAIISREVFEMAQAQAVNNKTVTKHIKHEYLLRRRVICGHCFYKMTCLTTATKSRDRQKTYYHPYYKCIGRTDKRPGCNCTQTTFKAGEVDTIIWDWLKSKIENRKKLTEALQEAQAEAEAGVGPLRARLKVIDDLLADNQQQLERLLDLYLSGDFDKEMLIERKKRLEDTIAALEKEQAGLVSQVEGRLLTDERIRSLEAFIDTIRQSLLDTDFETRRKVIELLDVQVRLVLEGSKRVAYPTCVLPGEPEPLPIMLDTSGYMRYTHWQKSLAVGQEGESLESKYDQPGYGRLLEGHL